MVSMILAVRLIAIYTALSFIALAILLTSTAFLGFGQGLLVGSFLIAVLWVAFKMLTVWQGGGALSIDELVSGDDEEPEVLVEKVMAEPSKRFRPRNHH